MARGYGSGIGPWNQRAVTIPPDSLAAWLHLAVWELWMGTLLCGFLAFGAAFIVTSPDRIVTAEDLSRCYAAPPIPQPCDRVVYKTGALNATFTALIGVLCIAAAAWFVWELWGAVEPKPITDDFLKLLNDSFARNWRDPRTWPWTRLLWAYGFTLVGAALTASAGLVVWTLLSSSNVAKVPTPKVNTSQSFRVDQ